MNIFIISWAGQHEKASRIARQISQINSAITIVYSDPDPNYVFDLQYTLIKRPNDLYWEDKFKACLDATDGVGMLVIHADTHCEDWAFLTKRCTEVSRLFENIGVWAPKIDGTQYDVNISGIFRIANSQLFLSALTDGIVFYLSPQMIDRMRRVEYGKNKFGWGIDCLFCAAAHVDNKLVLIDSCAKVVHPQGERGYDGVEAKLGMKDFLSQFSLRERIEYQLLRRYVDYNRAKLASKTRGIDR